jgi:hypothetical protein
MHSLEKNPDFFARYLSVWCWTCGRVKTDKTTFRQGERRALSAKNVEVS